MSVVPANWVKKRIGPGLGVGGQGWVCCAPSPGLVHSLLLSLYYYFAAAAAINNLAGALA